MDVRKRFALKFAVGLVSGLGLAAVATAQTFPSRPVTLLVPYPAGGLSDVIARTVNSALGRQLGQPVVIENLGGASGAIAAQKLLNAPADGHLIFQGSPNELILAPLAISAIKFRSEDFRLVQMISTAQIAFLARKDLPVGSVDELLDYARKAAREGRPLTYASVGPGSFYHILGEHLSRTTGIPLTHVPYKGMAPANQDLIGGQVDIFLAPYGRMYDSLHRDGKLKILAMLNDRREDSTRHYPLISDSRQLKNFDFSIWTGYFVRKDTPEPIVQALHRAITDTLGDPSVHAGLEANSQLTARPLSLPEVGKVYADGTAKFRAIARSIRLQAQ